MRPPSPYRAGLIRAALLALPLAFACAPSIANPLSETIMTKLAIPETRRVDAAEDHFGRRVADPYRWLENDVRNDGEVAAWVAAQNRVAEAHLNALPGRKIFRERLSALLDYERITAPFKRGGRYFYSRNPGLDNQPALHVRDGASGKDRLLIDPNGWSRDGSMALMEWAASKDGRRLAYAVQENGSDWRVIKIVNVDTGAVLDDTIQWARFTSIAWAADGSGFFYTRYPEPEAAQTFQAGVSGHAVYFHALGTPQSADRLVYVDPERPNFIHSVDATEDGRYLVVYSTPGAGNNALTVVDLESADWRYKTLAKADGDFWYLLGNVGTTLYVMTNKGAARAKVVTMDLGGDEPIVSDLVPERQAVLAGGGLLGGKLILSYLDDVKSEARRFELDGSPAGELALPGIGTVGAFLGQQDDAEVFYVFTSYNSPTTIYRYDVGTGFSTVWAAPKVPADLDNITVEQRFFASKDGAKIPLFVIRRKDVTAPAPTLLYGYGGFGIPLAPFYSPPFLAWIEQGGVAAVANLRGGGEYGKAWHDAGRGANKQNVFDDFIAAGEYLKAEGITSARGLAIQGESNGGLLVGAVANQRPDLFAAAMPGVGVMDMVRFPRFTGGQYWVDEYGDPRRADDFETLIAYSPYHTIRTGVDYPAILAVTGDTDDRVVPSHTFKYVAALQAADLGERPRLMRVDAQAGHGAGKSMDKAIAEVADMWAFAAHWTGLTPTAAPN